MAKIRKRTWKNKSGTHTSFEITYVINGKQYRKSGYQSMLEAQLDLPNVVLNEDTDIKFGVLADYFLQRHCELSCKQSTRSLYKNYIDVNLKDLERKIAKDLKKSDIEALVLKLKSKGLSPKTINDIVTLVQSILNYGVDNDFFKVNPIVKFKKLKYEKPEVHFLNEEQIQVFLELAEARTPKFFEFFATAIYTGMRRGELLALEWNDIDFKNAKIKINKQIYKGVKQSTKTSKSRTIDIPENLLNILREYKKQRDTIAKLVFHNGSGSPVHPYNMENRYFHPLIKLCNETLPVDNQIEKLRFHDLRHTYATYLLSKGVPVKYVQEQLGHSTARMTLDTYASVMPSVKFGALDLLNQLDKKEQIEHKLSTKN